MRTPAFLPPQALALHSIRLCSQTPLRSPLSSPFTSSPSWLVPTCPSNAQIPKRHRPTAALTSVPTLIDPVILRSSLSAISKLLATLLLGVAAAKRNLLQPQTLTALSKTVFSIFLPSLLLTNIVRTLSLGNTPGLFFLPLAALVQVFAGLVLSLAFCTLLGLRNAERRVFLVCSSFGNSAALPLLFANSLFSPTQPALAALVSGISFFLIGWTGLFWSIGYSTLAGMPDPSTNSTVERNTETEGNGKLLLKQMAKRILSPPLMAAFTGLCVGLSPFRNLFMSSPLFAALQTLGNGYSPAAVLILAGSLARKVEHRRSDEDDPDSRLRLTRLAVGISLCRYVVMPALGVAMVMWGKGVFRTPFVRFTLLMEAVMPPAQNSTLILNLEGRADAAASMARILLVVYLIGVVPVSVGLTLFLGMAGV